MEVAEAPSPVALSPRRRRAPRLAALGAVLPLVLSVLLPPAGAGAVPEGAAADLGAYEGLWLRVESEAEERALVSSIERTLTTVPRLLRALASGVMRRQIRPDDRYEFVVADGSLWLATDGDSRHPLPLDGQPRERRDFDGNTMTVTSQIAEGGALETSWKRGDSHGTSVYRLAGDGSTLVVEKTIASPHFEVPVEFRHTYRRSAGVSAAP
jgi:hypothetical protein